MNWSVEHAIIRKWGVELDPRNFSRKVLNTEGFIEPTGDKRAPETGTPVLVRLQTGPLADIDNWRREQQDLPSRSEAIRHLVELGLRRGKTR